VRRLRVALVFARCEGGPARAALTAALELDSEAYEHTVIAGTCGVPTGIEVVLAHGVPALAGALSAGRYDIVHTHGGTAGRFAGVRAGVPRVVHTWYAPPRPSLAERRAARRTDAFLAVGAATASRALRLGLAPPERLRSIWPAVELPTLPGTRAKARRLLGLPLGALIVGAVGPGSRPDVFARTIARLPSNVYGVWAEENAGPAPGAYGRLARRVADRLGGERVLWLGRRDDVTDLLPGFDVLAMTGRDEGVPYTAVEATAAGVPLVGTVTRGGPDIIRAGETGLLTAPRDPRRLADAIAYLLDNPAVARRMSQAARARVASRCDPGLLAVTLDEVYRGL
jgi:glycosyltransferase involved in cell wall biosynthesis